MEQPVIKGYDSGTRAAEQNGRVSRYDELGMAVPALVHEQLHEFDLPAG